MYDSARYRRRGFAAAAAYRTTAKSGRGLHPAGAAGRVGDREQGERYAACPVGRTFGKSMDSSAFIFASASSMIHICEL